LTHLIITGLKPIPGKRYLVWDTGALNLALVVYGSGTKIWYFIYSIKGRKNPQWLPLGDYQVVGLKEARKRARLLGGDVASGRDPVAERNAAQAVDTFDIIYGRYLEEHAKRHLKRWDQTDYLIRKHVLPRWGKLQVTAITRRDAKQLHRFLTGQEKPILANTVLAAAAAVFKWVMDEEDDITLTVNPCHGIKMNATEARKRVLSDAEFALFWNAFDSEELLTGTVLKLMLLTGQRGGEVRFLRREHIEDGCWWSLPGKPIKDLGWPGTKNGNDHGIYLSSEVRELIASVTVGQPTTGYVFATTRGKAVIKLDKAMRAINKKLEIANPVRPHDLRRTFATRAAEVGVKDQDIDRVLNHAAPQVGVSRSLSTYNRHRYEAEDMRIMERVANRIMALVEGGRDANVIAAPFRK
jgi:integrase